MPVSGYSLHYLHRYSTQSAVSGTVTNMALALQTKCFSESLTYFIDLALKFRGELTLCSKFSLNSS